MAPPFDKSRIKPGADLRGANLEKANLYGANLYRARLEMTRLREAILPNGEEWASNAQTFLFTDSITPGFRWGD